jgi:hypothetical protein
VLVTNKSIQKNGGKKPALERQKSKALTKKRTTEENAIHFALSPEEFRATLERLDALGLTWTSDIPPLIRAKTPESRLAIRRDEFLKIQKQYPDFPHELSHVILYALTGREGDRRVIGTTEEARQKADSVRRLIINPNPNFESEFFFKYAIKVPYFVDLDWEVVVKTFEKDVQDVPHIPYALVSLVFGQSGTPGIPSASGIDVVERDTITVAMNEMIVDRLIKHLTALKGALEKALTVGKSQSL